MAKAELPPWFVFDPTDTELVTYYLLPRVTNYEPLPVQGTIQDCNLYGNKHPWDIFKGKKSEETAYVFTKLKRKSPTAKVAIRTVGDKANGGGTWKLQAKGTHVEDDQGKIIGKKSSLSYLCKGKCGYGMEMGRWTMNEYSLDGILSGSALPELRNIVLCRIKNYPDIKGKTNQETEFGATSSTVYDQDPTYIQSTAMDFPENIKVYNPTTDFEVPQQHQEDDFLLEGNNGFAMSNGYDMIQEPNMEGHGGFSHGEALNNDPFLCIDNGSGVAVFQEFEITNPMMPLPMEYQVSTQPEKVFTGDSLEALSQCWLGDIEKSSVAQEPDIEYQLLPSQQEQQDDFDFFTGTLFDDLDNPPPMDGLAGPGEPLHVDWFGSVYMPDVQEITDDKTDQSRKRAYVFDQEDDEVQINNKKIREKKEDEDAEDGWFLL